MSIEFIQRWWLVGFIILAILMYLFGLAGYRVQEDARKRGMGKAAVTFWSVAVIFFGIIFLPLYLIFRSRAVFAGVPPPREKEPQYRLCPHCGSENQPDEKICRKCNKPMDLDLPDLGKKSCPYCGSMNPVEASRCSNCRQVIGIESEE